MHLVGFGKKLINCTKSTVPPTKQSTSSGTFCIMDGSTSNLNNGRQLFLLGWLWETVQIGLAARVREIGAVAASSEACHS
jgi:hypothetical protein